MSTETGVLTVVCFFQFLRCSTGLPQWPCGRASGFDIIPDSDDCGVFYHCPNGQPEMKMCAAGFSFRTDLTACVPAGSIYDTCIPGPCYGHSGMIPSAASCALYYDCNSTTQVDETWEPRLRECRYPYLFNTETRDCEHYKNVDCGLRFEPRSQCGYYRNQCRRAHCVPCQYRYPSCEGVSDGLQPWRGREGTPFYVECKNDRVVAQEKCPVDGVVQIFDSSTKKCVNIKTDFV